MKAPSAFLIASLALATAGCMSDRTRNMAETCQDLLDRNERSNSRAFIHDAEAQLATLGKPANKLAGFLRDLQDPDAMTYKPALEQCLWLLKSRQS